MSTQNNLEAEWNEADYSTVVIEFSTPQVNKLDLPVYFADNYSLSDYNNVQQLTYKCWESKAA